METDFKLSFLANQASRPDTGQAANLKQSGGQENSSFETTLDSRRKQAENHKNSEQTSKAKDKRRQGEREVKASKPEAKSASQAEKNEAQSANAAENQKVSDDGREALKAQDSKDLPDKIEDVEDEQAIAEVLAIPQEIIEEVMAQIADILGVTPEQVAKAMENLNLSISDISEPENANALIMAVKGMEEPSELLKMPELCGIRGQITEIAAKATEAAEALKIGVETQLPEEGAVNPDNAEQAAVELQGEANGSESAVMRPDSGAKQANAAGMEQAANTGTENTEEGITPEDTAWNKGVVQTEGKQEASGANARGEGNTRGGGEGSPENGAAQHKEAVIEPGEQAPVIIQKADETVVEAGGRTISRTQRAPVQSDVLSQIIDKMKVDFKPGSTEMKINLKPNELGNVTVKVATESGHVTAEIVTENSKVKELIEENIETLKESLKRQGVDVGELSVSVGQQDGGERMNQFMREQQKSHARMTRIINRIAGEEAAREAGSLANEAEINGNTVDFSA